MFSRRTTVGVGGLLLALGLAVYGNGLTNPFLIDDKEIILGDYRVREGRYGELLTGRYWPPPHQEQLYRPLVKLSYALNWAMSHEAWAFRLPNLLLHVGVGWVVFLLTRDVFRSFWAGVAAGAIFVVHPLHTEPLNAIVGRADLAATLLGLLAVWLYWREGAWPGWHGPGTITAAAAFAAAVLCKEHALTLVGVVFLLDWYRLRTTPGEVHGPGSIRADGSRTVPPSLNACNRPVGWVRSRILRCYLPLALVVIACLGVRGAVLGGLVREAAQINIVDNVIAHPEYGLGAGDSRFLARWGTPVAVFGEAAILTIWPHPLSWDHSYAAIETVKRWSDRRLWEGLAWLTLCVAAMVVSYRRRRMVFVAVGILLVTYSMVSNTALVIGTVFAERLMYLPSVGFCMLLGLCMDDGIDGSGGYGAAGASPRQQRRGGSGGRPHVRKLNRRTALTGSAALALGVVYAWLTVERNCDWRSYGTLVRADFQTHPRSCRLLSAAADVALEDTDYDTALALAEQAIAVYPDTPSAWRIAGLVHYHRQEGDRALLCFKRSFQCGGAGEEKAVMAAAELLAGRGDYRQAIGLLTQLVQSHRLALAARNNLAWLLLTAEPAELRDPQAALEHATEVLRQQPGSGTVLDSCVEALQALGRRDEAVRTLREWLPRVPLDDPYRSPLEEKLAQLTGG